MLGDEGLLMQPGDIYYFSHNSCVRCVKGGEIPQPLQFSPAVQVTPNLTPTTTGLNPNANVFQSKGPSSPPPVQSGEEEMPATGEWEKSVVAPEAQQQAPSPAPDGYNYMNGDASISPSDGSTKAVAPTNTSFPLSPESPPTIDYSQTNGTGILDGQVLYSSTAAESTHHNVVGEYSSPASDDDNTQPLEGTVPDDQLRELLKNQLEYYFSRENLANDTYLVSQMDADRFVLISTVAGFRQVKRLTNNIDLVVDVLRESTHVQVDDNGEKVRPLHKRCIVILREIPESTPVEDVKNLFNSEKCPRFASCEFAHNDSWYVTFETEAEAQGAYSYLREEVKTFLGKPIMARIKAKPLVRNSYGPKNGFKPPTPGATFDPVAGTRAVAAAVPTAVYSPPLPQAAQSPPTPQQQPAPTTIKLVTSQVPGVSLAPAAAITTIPSPVQVHTVQNMQYHVHAPVSQVQSAVSLPFFPPNNMPIWPNPAYFDPGTAFIANGYTPTATYKLNNPSTNKHNFSIRPHRHDRINKPNRYHQQQPQQNVPAPPHQQASAQPIVPVSSQQPQSQQAQTQHPSAPINSHHHQPPGGPHNHHHHHHHPQHHHPHHRDYHYSSYHDSRSYHHQDRSDHRPPRNLPPRHNHMERGGRNEMGITAVPASPRGGEKMAVSVTASAAGRENGPAMEARLQEPKDMRADRGIGGRTTYRTRRRGGRLTEDDVTKRAGAPPSKDSKISNESFELEANSFPPLPGASNNSSSGEVFESKMSDVVKGKAKAVTKATTPTPNTPPAAMTTTSSEVVTTTVSSAPLTQAPVVVTTTAAAPAVVAAASAKEKPSYSAITVSTTATTSTAMSSLPSPPCSPHKSGKSTAPEAHSKQNQSETVTETSSKAVSAKPEAIKTERSNKDSASKKQPPHAQTPKQEESQKSPPLSPAIENAPPKISYASIVAKAKAKKDAESNSGSDKASDEVSAPVNDKKDQAEGAKNISQQQQKGQKTIPPPNRGDRDARNSQGEFRQVSSKRAERAERVNNNDKKEGPRGLQRDYDRSVQRK